MNEMEIKSELFALKGAVAMLLAADSIEKGLKLEELHEKLVNTFAAILTPAQGLASECAKLCVCRRSGQSNTQAHKKRP